MQNKEINFSINLLEFQVQNTVTLYQRFEFIFVIVRYDTTHSISNKITNFQAYRKSVDLFLQTIGMETRHNE